MLKCLLKTLLDYIKVKDGNMIRRLSFGFLIFALLFGFGELYPRQINVTHGDKIVYVHSGSFDLHKDITHKQFSTTDNTVFSDHNNCLPTLVKRNAKKANHYLSRVNNLNKYHLYISLTSNVGAYRSEDTVTELITFVRKE